MTDRRLHDMEVEDLERLLRGLPRRAPSAELRRRVLAAGAVTRRPLAQARPALAAAVLVALVALDALVVNLQDRQLARALPAPPAAMVAVASVPDPNLAWLRELGLPNESVAVVALTRQAVTRDTYLSLRDSLLANGSGG
ncbi:MAG TPA: hypothetical protein VMY87_05415 [Armatimonadota bacterium]|nr:hypothetical protein [Armatimonadota bacterium]